MDVSGADLGSPAQTSPASAARIPSLKWLAPAGSPRRQHGAEGKGQEAYHASGAELALLVPGAQEHPLDRRCRARLDSTRREHERRAPGW